jgi:hypothetical protein
MSERTVIHRVGFAAGLRWLPAGAELLAAGFGPMAGIASLWLLLSMVAIVVPVIGQLALVLFTPLLTAGVLIAFHRLRQGQPVTPFTLFAAWQDPARRTGLIVLGLVTILGSMIAATVLLGWMSSQLTQTDLEAAMQDPEALLEALAGTSLGGGLIMALIIFSLMLGAIYFAIPLVSFAGWPVWPAMLASIRAIFANWAAFLGFGLVFMLFAAALGLMLALTVSLLGLALGQAGLIISQVLILLATMLVQVLMAGVQYVAFSQVFGWSRSSTDKSDGDSEDQLIA